MTEMTPNTFTLSQVEEVSEEKIEEIINALDMDSLLGFLNEAQQIRLSAKEANEQPSEKFLRASILVTRRIRNMREEGKRATRKSSTPKVAPTIDSLFG